MDESRMEIREIINKALYAFLFSILGFYTIDINTYTYLIIAVTIWAIIFCNYQIMKNRRFYMNCIIIGILNIIAFALAKYIKGYRFVGDLEDVFGCSYLVLMVTGIFINYFILSDENKIDKHDDNRLEKRKYDLERVKEYLKDVDIIGLKGRWGTGKTFLVEMLREDEEIKKNYDFIKINLLSSNLDNIEKHLINELSNVLNKNRIYSSSATKLKKVLEQDSILKRLGYIIEKNNESYSDVFDDFRTELDKIERTIVIVYEDIDRVDNIETIKKIFSISENLASKKIKIIYEYDEENMIKISDKFTRDYLEKYIPFTIQLTSLSFFDILTSLFEKVEISNLDIIDFDYLKKTIYIDPYIKEKLGLDGKLQIRMPDISIRKLEHFLKELSVTLESEKIYRNNKQDVITVYYIKHFWYCIYEKFNVEDTIIDSFRYKYKKTPESEDIEEYTILELIKLVEEKKISRDEVKVIFDDPDNQCLLYLFMLFGYECNIEEVKKIRKEVSNESIENINKKNKNEQKNRLLWNLICNGKSQYTDRDYAVSLFKNMVINKTEDKRDEGYSEFCKKLYHGEFEKKDNKTIFRLGLSKFLFLFQAYRVAKVSSKDWMDFIEFYMKCKKAKDNDIDIEYIENINYCNLDYKEVYLYVLKSFCELSICGNMNKQECYKKFLRNYLGQLSILGFINTEVLWLLDENNDIDTIGVDRIKRDVLECLKGRLNKLKENIFIDEAKEDIDIIIRFIDKNINIIENDTELKHSEPTVKTETKIQWKNQVEIDRLNKIYEEVDFKVYKKEVENSYKEEKILAGEIGELPSTEKNK